MMLQVLQEELLHRKHSPLDIHNRRALKIGGEQGALHCGAHQHDAEVGAGLSKPLHEGKNNVGVDVALVDFVDDEMRDAGKGRVRDHQRHENTRRHEGHVTARAVVEANRVPNVVAHILQPLRRDALGDGGGGDAARLRDEDVRLGAAEVFNHVI